MAIGKNSLQMKFAIMYEASPRWGGTDENDMLEHLMPFWMENYFKRGNYLIIDNKPVLFVFCQKRLSDECFESAESQRKTFDACRKYAKQFGFDGMTFACCDRSNNIEVCDEIMSRGYDFRFAYCSGYNPPYSPYDDQEEIFRMQCELFKNHLIPNEKQYIPTASCFWDPTPRFSERWISLGYNFHKSKIWYLTPEYYRKLIHELKAISDSLPEDAWARKIFMIDNWNEWDEGHFVAPSHKFGFKYLQAIREELTERDNLPDYRTPQDQGFDGYNTKWVTPDFGDSRK